MNKIILFIMFVLLINIANAEVSIIRTDIQFSLANSTMKVTTEDGGNFDLVCNPGTVYTSTRQITFLRNVSCTTDVILTQQVDLIRSLSLGFNDSAKYYDKYLDCYGKYTLCNERLGQANSTQYEERYMQAFQDLQTCKTERNTFLTTKQQSDSELSVCLTGKKSAEDGKIVWGIIGAIAGAILYYWFFDKSKNKPATSAAESQLPKSR